ncbi:MAG: DUF4179 domain-containing protein [Tissierellia bacterium]|nr:DUF4179 domain-containing protein [Tissierellia bacterium]
MKDYNIFEILNNLVVDEPDNDRELNSFELNKIKKSLKPRIAAKKKNNWIPKIVAAALIVGFMLTSPGQELYAAVLNTYDMIVESMTNSAASPQEIDDYISKPELQLIDNNILVSVEEILIDENKMYLTLISEILDTANLSNFNKDKEISATVLGLKILLNGNNILEGNKGSSQNLSNTISQTFTEADINGSIDDKSKIDILINSIGLYQNSDSGPVSQEINGDWKFTISGKELKRGPITKIVEFDKKIGAIGNSPIYADYLSYNNFRINLFLKRSKNNIPGLPIEVLAKDKLNREYRFQMTTDKGLITTLEYVGNNGAQLLEQNEITLQLFYWEKPIKSGKTPDLIPAGEPVEIILEK